MYVCKAFSVGFMSAENAAFMTERNLREINRTNQQRGDISKTVLNSFISLVIIKKSEEETRGFFLRLYATLPYCLIPKR